MTSGPSSPSTADAYGDAKEIAALRPMVPAKPRAPRKAPPKVAVSSGIVCFCGERCAECQGLELMKHRRAEYGEVLQWRERHLETKRRHNRKRRADPVYRQKQAAHKRSYYEANRERLVILERERRQGPAVREREAKRYARR